MKIFAKRTKKKSDSSAPRTVNKSDPIVEELLKKDPEEWNAKERRMVKRYRDRKATEPNETVGKATNDETEKTEDAIDESKEENDQEDSDADNSSSSSEDEEENTEKIDTKRDDVEDDDEETTSGNSASSEKVDDELASIEKVENPDTSAIEKEETDTAAVDQSEEDDGKVPKDHEIWGVLDKLNSKQKRTLSRKLDRMGKSVLEEVEQEANKILDEINPIAEDLKRDQIEAASTDKAPSVDIIKPTKKKRKKGADWSHLPAEERLRREDQRKKQQEALERRARGESIKPGHKRPLNSERRRANRRKPKWGSKTPSGAPDISDYKQEHHSSGFHHRKDHRSQQQAMNHY